MNTLMVLAVVGLIAAVSGNPAGDKSNPGGPNKPAGGASPGGLALPGSNGGAVPPKEEGGFFGGERGDRFSCACKNQCHRIAAGTTKYLSCPSSRAEFLKCVGTACTNETCADQQLFNHTSGACESCPKGEHVDAEKRMCVCDKSTTFDLKTHGCGPCPTDSIQEVDRCFCSNVTVLHRAANACKTCPTGSKQEERECVCTDKQQFWNAAAFACQSCPGEWVNVTIPAPTHHDHAKTRVIEVCECPNSGVFNRRNVTCQACPTNTSVKMIAGENICSCGAGEWYDIRTNTCVAHTAASLAGGKPGQHGFGF